MISGAMTRPPDPSVVADPAARLRNAGLRVTAPRVAVLRYLEDQPHAAADDITGAVHTAPVMSSAAACG